MISRLEKFFLGDRIIYVRQSTLAGAKVIMVGREEYELLIRKLTWQTVRAFIMGIILVTVVGIAAFAWGARAAWIQERETFRKLCGQVVQETCGRHLPRFSPRRPFRQDFGASPIRAQKVMPWDLIDKNGCLMETPS